MDKSRKIFMFFYFFTAETFSKYLSISFLTSTGSSDFDKYPAGFSASTFLMLSLSTLLVKKITGILAKSSSERIISST